MELSLFISGQHNPTLLLHNHNTSRRRVLNSKQTRLRPCHCSLSTSSDDEGRRAFMGFLLSSSILVSNDVAEAASTSRRALRASKIPESEFTTLPNGLKYYDIKVGGGKEAVKGSRVAVHYVAKWKGITFMTSRQGMGVGGGTPYGFDVGESERGNVLKGLDVGVQGMRVGGQRLLLVPPQLAYGSKGVQEIPPNATIELDVELLSIKQSPFGSDSPITMQFCTKIFASLGQLLYHPFPDLVLWLIRIMLRLRNFSDWFPDG
ncbi:hypothetical protein ACFE04_002715 [Oxalis oulophora]